MTDITTSISITLRHRRQLTEAEFKNLTRNIFEHIAYEHRANPGAPGFADIAHVGGAACHQVDGEDVVPDRKWGWSPPEPTGGAGASSNTTEENTDVLSDEAHPRS